MTNSSPIKEGFLQIYQKGVVSNKWKRAWCTLYSDSGLFWYKNRGDPTSKGNLLIKTICEFMLVGAYTRSIKLSPDMPEDGKIDNMIALPQEPKRNGKWNFFLCDNDGELNDWMTAIISTLPPREQKNPTSDPPYAPGHAEGAPPPYAPTSNVQNAHAPPGGQYAAYPGGPSQPGMAAHNPPPPQNAPGAYPPAAAAPGYPQNPQQPYPPHAQQPYAPGPPNYAPGPGSYAPRPAQQPHPQQPYPQQPYPQQSYPQQPYPQQPYPQQPYPQQPYAQQPYPQQPYAQQPYPQQAYPRQPYPQSGYPQQPHYQGNPYQTGHHPVPPAHQQPQTIIVHQKERSNVGLDLAGGAALGYLAGSMMAPSYHHVGYGGGWGGGWGGGFGGGWGCHGSWSSHSWSGSFGSFGSWD